MPLSEDVSTLTAHRGSDRGSRPIVELCGDRVLRVDDRIIVHSPVAYPGWEVRRYRRTAIRFEGSLFHLVRTSRTGSGLHRYVLEPWPEESRDDPAREIVYDLDYVLLHAACDSVIKRSQRLRPLLIPVIPIAGFLPSSWKLVLHERCGLDVRSVTAVSLVIEYVAVILCGAGASIASFTAPAFVSSFLLPAGVIGADAAMRYSSLHEERMDLPGFYEWILPRLRRR